MKTLHFCIGLPRSGSTLLMNILNENPQIYTTGTCPLPYIVMDLRTTVSNTVEMVAMDMDVLSNSLVSFFKYGFDGWFQAQTDKPVVFSKSRVWDQNLRHLFKIYENPKFIVTIRDPRDIIVSFEKLLKKYPHVLFGSKEFPFEWNSFDKRIEYYCTDMAANLGRPLGMIKHVLEYMQNYPKNFFIFKWEWFCQDPNNYLSAIYKFLEMPDFSHNLDNIPPSDYYEHDNVYRSLVSHKVRSKFEPIFPQWPNYLNSDQNATVLHNLKWFYEIFYPELLDGNKNERKFETFNR